MNIQNKDNRCFGYEMLYFLERANALKKHNHRPALYTDEMFERHIWQNLPYPIGPSAVSNCEDIMQINITLFSFFDDEGKARYPMFISQQNYPR